MKPDVYEALLNRDNSLLSCNDAVLKSAQRWLGTPYRHQGAIRGVGCDCIGLIRGIWRELLGEFSGEIPSYSRDWREAASEEVLLTAMDKYFKQKPISAASPGDILVFRMGDGRVAKHLGILSAVGATPWFIHAYSGRGVVQNSLSRPWARRVVACFEFPERNL